MKTYIASISLYLCCYTVSNQLSHTMNINTTVFLNYMTSDKLTKVSIILLQQLLAL